ncbi:MAG TPA: hypothetical protein VFG32_11735, partial [Bacteroidota bacterium]|nr:hypothetical protein [Bacteroidota bacterium]
ETFTPTTSSPDSVRVDQALVGELTGAGNLTGIPYVGTLWVMGFTPVSSDTSSLSLSNIVVTDQNGIDISPLTVGNASQIIVDPTITQGITVDVKVFLQGPYSGTTMSPTLNSSGLLPLSQPYTASPFSYSGTESVPSIPNAQVVDWVMLELRTGTGAATKFATRAGFILSNGLLADLNGSSPMAFTTIDPGSYYIVVRHRNHLAVMSTNAVALSNSGPLYNFTTAQTQAFGTSPMKDLGGGVYGMLSGDGNASGGVNVTDRNLVWRPQNGTLGYLAGDYNLSGGVNVTDRNLFWRPNNGFVSQVP